MTVEWIVAPRQGGKTTRLVEAAVEWLWANPEGDVAIVCHNYQESRRLFNALSGLVGAVVTDASHARQGGLRGRRLGRTFVDNADAWSDSDLYRLIVEQHHAVTATRTTS